MRCQWLRVAVFLGMTLLGGTAYAGSDPAVVQGTVPAPSAPIQSEVPLVLSIRALSLGQPPLTETGEMERVRAATGAGTSRWPQATTSIGPGVYITVMPGCIPGIDEPLRPSARRR